MGMAPPRIGTGPSNLAGQSSIGSGQPPPAPGLNLSGGSLNTGRIGGAGSFGAMQSGTACSQPVQSSSYNPSGEILAMINKGQGLGLPPNKALGLGSSGLPQGIAPPGMAPAGIGQVQSQGQGLNLGSMTPQPELGSAMASSGFDMSDFPSLSHRATGSAGLQQFRSPGHTVSAQSEFAIVSEDFPELPGAKSSALASSGCGSVAGTGGASILRGGASVEVEPLLSMKETSSGSGTCLQRLDEPQLLGGCTAPGGHGSSAARADRFGLMGILSVIRMTDQDLNTLALGTDLTTLGLNLNSSDCLYATFASPWADSPAQRDPEFTLPQCYYMQPPALKTGHFSKFQLETLFYIFYNMPRDTLQAYAATELYNRDWRYHKDLTLWFTRASRGAEDNPKGQYIYFDINEWKKKMFHGAGQAVSGTTPGVGDNDGDGDDMRDMTME
eukprot:CAMPEP_0119336628 /NCGR_PEP_ID=MMETSP1333-20130426/92232_1 /TAXON_ID=418940 /ORGANISM="Scyphosphaera apsteinii, Strain RCC1455" /LENGTH=441 /DNA_ID=CAMNT_0007347471 /DNA_START=91 /DNA_END=1416 /DNA_ORIENTATION=+